MSLKAYLNEHSLNGLQNGCLNDKLNELCALLDITYRCLGGMNYVHKPGLLNAVVDAKGTKFSQLDTLVRTKNIQRDTLSRLRDTFQKSIQLNIAPVKDSYKYNGMEYRGSSIACAYEDAIVNDQDHIVLASFPNGGFDVAHMSVSKNDENTINLCNVTSSIGYGQYLSNVGLLNDYDKSSKLPPSDEQSIFVTNPDFEYTGKRETDTKAKRKVYCRKSKGDYWFIDGAHNDGGAHYEVFTADLRFKGSLSFFETDLDKIRIPKNNNEKKRKLHMQ